MSDVSSGRQILNLTSLSQYEAAVFHSIKLPGHAEVSLVPIGPWIFAQPQVIREMTKWRANARTMFFAQFPESVATMSEYLSSTKIETTESVLFLIDGKQHGFLGHLGLKNISGESAEIDSVMRGSVTPTPQLMFSALYELILWSTETLHIRRLSLNVVSYNTRAIALYSRLGFECVGEIPLFRASDQDYVWHHQTESDRANVDYRCVVMEKRMKSTL